MAKESVSMNKFREILRLKQEGLSNRRAAISLRLHRKTVSRYLSVATAKGINWMTIQAMSDVEVEKELGMGDHSEKSNIRRGMSNEPDWAYIHAERKKRHVTLALLWEEYKEENSAGYQYSWFNELYCNWREKLNISMRQDHNGGEKLFVDYCDGIGIIDGITGQITQTQLFTAVWGASNYLYAEASLTQNKRDWIMSHVRAFEHFGCVPQMVVPDNLKTAITKACRYEPDVNRTYLDLSQHYNFVIIPARPWHPKDKAKVETGVLFAQRWILACLRNRKFYSLAELNTAIKELLEKANNRQMQKLKKTRKEMFLEIDKPKASPLIEHRYEYADWIIAGINIDYHIEAQRHYYSLPYQQRMTDKHVDVRISDNTVEIFYKGKRLASHVRSCEKYKHTTNPEHMPSAHRKYLEWNPERINSWAEKIGPWTKQMVGKILESRKHPEQGYRSCLGILRLSNNYTDYRLENACKRAVTYKAFSYKSIKIILERKFDEQPDFLSQTGKNVLPVHENIRGRNYYNDDNKKLLN